MSATFQIDDRPTETGPAAAGNPFPRTRFPERAQRAPSPLT